MQCGVIPQGEQIITYGNYCYLHPTLSKHAFRAIFKYEALEKVLQSSKCRIEEVHG